MKDFDILKSKLILIPVFLASVVASVYLLQIVFNFLSQFGWLFLIFIYAYIIYVFIAPLDRLLQSANISPKVSLYLSFLIIISLVILVVFFLNPIVTSELYKFSEQLKKADLNTVFGNFVNNLSGLLNTDTDQVKQTLFDNVKNFGLTATNNLINLASNAVFALFQIVIALIIGYFIIKDGRRWFKDGLHLIPKNYRDEAQTIVTYFNRSASSFLRTQVFMAFIYSIINFAVMTVLGLDFALTSSIIAFITFIIPGIGPVLSMIGPLSIAFLFDPSKALWLLIILLVAQQIILNIIIPKVYGDKMGIHPIVILLSILVGIQLFGVIGAFVVIPVITVLINVLSVYIPKKIKD